MPRNKTERCNERCNATLQPVMQRPSISPQVVENISALHATLQGVAHRCVAPPLIGGATVQRCNGKAKGLEHVGAILARLAAENPERWAWLLPPPKDFLEAPPAGRRIAQIR